MPRHQWTKYESCTIVSVVCIVEGSRRDYVRTDDGLCTNRVRWRASIFVIIVVQGTSKVSRRDYVRIVCDFVRCFVMYRRKGDVVVH